MSEEQQERIALFAYNLGQVTGFVAEALETDELLQEFSCRDLKRSDLEALLETSKKVAQVFYNTAQPV